MNFSKVLQFVTTQIRRYRKMMARFIGVFTEMKKLSFNSQPPSIINSILGKEGISMSQDKAGRNIMKRS
jgi:hypothetical protein